MSRKDVTITIYVVNLSLEELEELSQAVDKLMEDYPDARVNVNFRDSRNVVTGR